MIRAAERVFAALALLIAMPAQADDFRLRGELGAAVAHGDATSQVTALGFQTTSQVAGKLRPMWETTAGPLRFELHADVAVARGNAVALAVRAPNPPPATLFDLTGDWQWGDDARVRATLDRASVAYASDDWVVKAGRQAITWGNGLVFHPADIVAPFAPDAIDTSYKPGVDMLYVQHLFESGADIQAIAAPRPERRGGPVRLDASTLALRASASIDAFDGQLTLARDRGDSAVGLGASGPLGDAVCKADYVHWILAEGGSRPSLILNITNFGRIADRNVSYYAEYFHNGFGVGSGRPVDALPPALLKRMAAGQVFNAGRDFLALGASVEMTPDISLAPGVIISLNDGSVLASLTARYIINDTAELSLDLFQPLGRDGTEFGGRETSAGSGVFAGPSTSAALRLILFF